MQKHYLQYEQEQQKKELLSRTAPTLTPGAEILSTLGEQSCPKVQRPGGSEETCRGCGQLVSAGSLQLPQDVVEPEVVTSSCW